jgi:hypothetical protein
MPPKWPPFDNILVYYGHGQIKVTGRKTQMVDVPPGICVVSIVETGDESWYEQQDAFHALCKLANEATTRGREASTWLRNPIVYKTQIEHKIDSIAEKARGSTILRIACGDFEDEAVNMTPVFIGTSYTDDTGPPTKINNVDTYDIKICKSGLYFLDQAGEGDYVTIDKPGSDGILYLDDILSVYEGSVFPKEENIKSITDEALDWPNWTYPFAADLDPENPHALHTTWKHVLRQEPEIDINPDIVFGLLNDGHRGVFYNLACRVVMKSDIGDHMTRAILAGPKLAEAAALKIVGAFSKGATETSAVSKKQSGKTTTAKSGRKGGRRTRKERRLYK